MFSQVSDTVQSEFMCYFLCIPWEI